MNKTDDGTFPHESNAEVLTPQSVIAADAKVTSRAGDKPESVPWSPWSDSKYDKPEGQDPFRP